MRFHLCVHLLGPSVGSGRHRPRRQRDHNWPLAAQGCLKTASVLVRCGRARTVATCSCFRTVLSCPCGVCLQSVGRGREQLNVDHDSTFGVFLYRSDRVFMNRDMYCVSLNALFIVWVPPLKAFLMKLMLHAPWREEDVAATREQAPHGDEHAWSRHHSQDQRLSHHRLPQGKVVDSNVAGEAHRTR